MSTFFIPRIPWLGACASRALTRGGSCCIDGTLGTMSLNTEPESKEITRVKIMEFSINYLVV